jgi:hypothetical protein
MREAVIATSVIDLLLGRLSRNIQGKPETATAVKESPRFLENPRCDVQGALV